MTLNPIGIKSVQNMEQCPQGRQYVEEEGDDKDSAPFARKDKSGVPLVVAEKFSEPRQVEDWYLWKLSARQGN
ncbi:hypothetical protein CCACVL1_21020 [Corchorus capsularis]|uniref:Uncharacterized protein n=1 Tax=Corchorus capsularis TaxID=210143 RepID=A0A1R3H8P7_COCAP|nr:hypothetical protein CCACVL1_21020 [Corchorus capsularis]